MNLNNMLLVALSVAIFIVAVANLTNVVLSAKSRAKMQENILLIIKLDKLQNIRMSKIEKIIRVKDDT